MLRSRYGRLWAIAGSLAGAAWIAVAVTQTPRVPLMLFVLSLSLAGGILVVPSLPPSTLVVRRLCYGALCAAAGALVTVGIGHHPVAGLLTVAALGATSPTVVRLIARGVSR